MQKLVCQLIYQQIFCSNGFKLRSASGANPSTNQGTIIYLARGQTLVGTNNSCSCEVV